MFSSPVFGNIRVLMDKDGNPLFYAPDACRSLGLGNVTEALRGLDEDEKMTLRISEGHSGTRGGAQFANFITESGLYRLIFKSRKPEAHAFRRWITHHVLPAIRKAGRYEVPGLRAPELLRSPEQIDRDQRLLVAEQFKELANTGFYTPAATACLRAKAVCAITGEPMEKYLPKMADDGRELWLSPTQMAEILSEKLNAVVTAYLIGKILMDTKKHGIYDLECRYSWPYSSITHKITQKWLYKYKPYEVMGMLEANCRKRKLKPRPQTGSNLLRLIKGLPEGKDGKKLEEAGKPEALPKAPEEKK
jgi:prophage antirepressor-like protein